MRRRSILGDNTEDVSAGSSSSKRNRFAKNRRSKREARLRSNRNSDKKSGGLLKFTILIIVVSISAAFIIYNIYSAGSSTDDLLYKYTHLSERVVKDSKNQFNKKLHFIKVNEDGTKEISIGFSSDIVKQEVEEEVNNATGGANITSLDIDINGWYTDVTAGTPATTSKSVFADGSSLAIYDGPPWDVENGSYIFNYPQARYDTYKMFEGLGISGNPITDSNMYSAAVVGGAGTTNRLAEHGFDTSTGLKEVDGVICLNFGPMPTLVDRTWINNWTQGATCASSAYGYGEARYAAILVDKNTGNIDDSTTWKYLPLCPNDSKAHTYPWGVVQTNIKIISANQLQFSRNWSGTSTQSQYNKQYSNDIGTDDSIKDALLTISKADHDLNFKPTVTFNAYTWYNHALELYAQGSNVVNAFSKYKLVGIMYFGEG